jgi:hypothetical protein
MTGETAIGNTDQEIRGIGSLLIYINFLVWIRNITLPELESEH